MECTVELPVTERTDPSPRAVFLWAKAQAPFFQGGWALVPGNIVPRSRGRARVWGPLKGGTPNGPDVAGR